MKVITHHGAKTDLVLCAAPRVCFDIYFFVYLLLLHIDGTVVWAQFDLSELGTAMSAKEMEKQLRNLYGDHILSLPRNISTLAEDPSQLYLAAISKEVKSCF